MMTGNLVASGSQPSMVEISERLRINENDEMNESQMMDYSVDHSMHNGILQNGSQSVTDLRDLQGSCGRNSFPSTFNQEISKYWRQSWNDSSGGGGSISPICTGNNCAPGLNLQSDMISNNRILSAADAMILVMLKQQQLQRQSQLNNGHTNGYCHPSANNFNGTRSFPVDNFSPIPNPNHRHSSSAFDFSSVGASLAEILESAEFPNSPTPYSRRSISGSMSVSCAPPVFRPLSNYCNQATSEFLRETINPSNNSMNHLQETVPHSDTMGFLQDQHESIRVYHEERYSRKVFVGGLPPDIDEEEIIHHFRRFGPLLVDWPHKAESKSYFPPKGYAFLIYSDERSVQDLIEACVLEDQKLYMCVSSPSIKDKPVQIRPWLLSDSDYVMDGSQPLDPRKTIFVGGVPRPLRAVELALIMNRLYGGVCYAGIDTDPELKYPKGAGRVAFSNQQSYIAAISARFVQLRHTDIDKRVEVKPYVLDDQMCDECQGTRCNGKYAPFFCANVTCLQYYCENCWSTIHCRSGREYHKPLVKEGADRPRNIPYRWS